MLTSISFTTAALSLALSAVCSATPSAASSSAASSSLPSPLSVPASQSWDGNDGPWSTFSLSLGNPPQIVRVHVSTYFSNTIAVLNEACPDGNDSSCADARGKLFTPNSSTTYEQKGIFQLYPELNFTTKYDAAQFGFDTLGLGLPSDGHSVKHQVIASARTDDYYIGVLGINPQPTNFTFTDESPSLMTTLKKENKIPSIAYSYTAGNQYRNKMELGRLILGGYEPSKLVHNDLTFNMAPDVSRDLVLSIQSISKVGEDSSPQLLTSGVEAFIDTTFPYLVLPFDTCKEFEQQLDLKWDDDAELYTVSDTVHNQLVSSKFNLSFVLSNQNSGGDQVTIDLPYAAFDLEADTPLVDSKTRYFPLKRAANDSQVTIGRAFFQEAVLIADYERGNFSVYQRNWDDGADDAVIPIYPKGYTGPMIGADGSSTSSGGLTKGAQAGIAVGVVLGAIILTGLFLCFAYWKRVWPFKRQQAPAPNELDSSAVLFEPDGTPVPKTRRVEADSNEKRMQRPELFGSDGSYFRKELPGSLSQTSVSEGPSPGAAYGYGGRPEKSGLHSPGLKEMEGSQACTELMGSPVPSTYLSAAGGGDAKTERSVSQRTSITVTTTTAGGAHKPLPPQPPRDHGDDDEISQMPSPETPAVARKDRPRYMIVDAMPGRTSRNRYTTDDVSSPEDSL